MANSNWTWLPIRRAHSAVGGSPSESRRPEDRTRPPPRRRALYTGPGAAAGAATLQMSNRSSPGPLPALEGQHGTEERALHGTSDSVLQDAVQTGAPGLGARRPSAPVLRFVGCLQQLSELSGGAGAGA